MKMADKEEIPLIKDFEPVHAEHVACEVCKKEVPKTEATVAEAADYVMFFCGLDCYDEWKKDADNGNGEAKK